MKREVNYDYLRALAALMVVAVHTSNFFLTGDHGFGNVDFTLGNLFTSLSRMAVPLFVMLSGAFVLGADKNRDVKAFCNSHLAFILAVTILWNLIYFVFGKYAMRYDLSIKYLILTGAAGAHLWFMPLIAGLYVATPFLIKLKERVGVKWFFAFGLFALLIAMFGITEKWYFASFRFVGYYILGDFLKNYLPVRRSSRRGLVVYLVAAMGMFLGMELTGYGWFYTNNCILIMAGSIGLFVAFSGLKCSPNKLLSSVVKHSLDIYLVHYALLSVLWHLIVASRIGIFHGYSLIWGIPLLVLGVFVLSWLLSIAFYHPVRWFIRVAMLPPIKWALRLALRAGDVAVRFFGKYSAA